MKFQYLLIDSLVIIIPLLFSFHPRIKFYESWKPLFMAIITASVPFVVFDSIFTLRGVWGFNPGYITGIYLYNLPIEEILFFVCVPYSCLFTYFCFDKFYNISSHLRPRHVQSIPCPHGYRYGNSYPVSKRS